MEEEKIKLGESLYWLDKDNILNITAIGDTTDDMAPEYCRIIAELLAKNKGKTNWLVDLNKAGNQSAGARRAYKEMSNNEKSGKVAVFGLSPVTRVIASFVMGIANNPDIRFFKTKEEAIAWLKE